MTGPRFLLRLYADGFRGIASAGCRRPQQRASVSGGERREERRDERRGLRPSRASARQPCARGRRSSSTATTPNGWCARRSSSSWTRSGAAITVDVTQAPLADEGDTRAFWQGSPLQIAVSRVEDDLRRTAEDGDLVLAVTDADTRILWTYGGRVMRRKAESVNFVAGGRWDDESVGTNALDLANRTSRPAMVFSRGALRLDRAQLGLLGGAGERPGDRPAARRDRPVDDLGPHPPDRARDRADDGAADRAGDAALARAPGAGPARVARRRRPDAAAARHRRGAPRRPTAAAQPAPDRDPRPARDEPRGCLARAAARAGLRRPGRHPLHAEGRGLAPARGPAAASSARGPTA